MKPTTGKCLKPDCHRVAIARGLCSICYKTTVKLVREKKTTWPKQEKLGRALPSTHVSQTNIVNWVLGK